MALQKQYTRSLPGVLLIITVVLHAITLISVSFYCVELLCEKGPPKFRYILPDSCIAFHHIPSKFNVKGLPRLDELYVVLAGTSLGILLGVIVFLAKLCSQPSRLPWKQLDFSHNISMGLICIVSIVLQSLLVNNHENFLIDYFIQHLKTTGQQVKLISFGMSWKIATGLLILSTIIYAIQTLLTYLESRHLRSRKKKRKVSHHVRFASSAEVIIMTATDQQTTTTAKATDTMAHQQGHVTEADSENGSLSSELIPPYLCPQLVDSTTLIKKCIRSETVKSKSC